MQTLINTFLVVLAATFPVVNRPGSALVFLGLTGTWTPEIRRALARRVAFNSLLVLVCSFLIGALILQFYGISIPVLRVAGGFVVAVSGWKLLNEGSHKEIEAPGEAVPARRSAQSSLLLSLDAPSHYWTGHNRGGDQHRHLENDVLR